MIKKELFEVYNNKNIFKYTLSDEIIVEIINLGGTIISLYAKDKNDNYVDVALGFTNINDIINKSDYMGSIIGRTSNRIENGKFTINDINYQLALNENNTTNLHGGVEGFNKKVFDGEIKGNSLFLTYNSDNMEENYPGNLKITVKYTVKESQLIIEYFGITDNDTIFSPTNHIYFNLNGENDGSILDNYIKINAKKYLPIKHNLIPIGIEEKVDNTVFDFQKYKMIGQDINNDNEQLLIAGGYDHNFCTSANYIASAYSEKTNILMNVYSDMPGVQFYTGNFLNGSIGKSIYRKRSGFCLETQFYPNSINNDCWKKPVLRKEDKFYSRTIYEFEIK